MQNTQLCAWSGGFEVLMKAVINPDLKQQTEQIILTLVYFINDD